MAWNVVGSVLVLVAAAAARSVALAGFGLDSLIEILASAVVVWQLKDTDKARERTALRLIGYAFVLLALYIGVQSLYVLAAGFRPRHSRRDRLARAYSDRDVRARVRQVHHRRCARQPGA